MIRSQRPSYERNHDNKLPVSGSEARSQQLKASSPRDWEEVRGCRGVSCGITSGAEAKKPLPLALSASRAGEAH